MWEQHLHDTGLVVQVRTAIACAECVDASAFWCRSSTHVAVSQGNREDLVCFDSELLTCHVRLILCTDTID